MPVLFLVLAAALGTTDVPPFSVRVDTPRHGVVIRLGPFPLPATIVPPGHEGMHHVHGLELPVFRFVWSAEGWARGFRVAIFDGEGEVLPRRLLHHVNLIRLDRRQLTQPIFERTLAVGAETDEVILPNSVGVRIESGTEMGLLTAWSNETGADLPEVILELTLPYLPENIAPRPLEVRSIGFDIGFHAGFHDAFDLDTGRTVHQREFILPLDGKLLAVGGHLHDYAESLELIDVGSGKVLVALKPESDARGKVLSVSRKIYGISGDGLSLKAGRRYLVVAVYNNPTGHYLENGGMAVLGGIFAPDDPRQWPPVDRTDPVFLADAGGLDRIGWVTVTRAGERESRRP